MLNVELVRNGVAVPIGPPSRYQTELNSARDLARAQVAGGGAAAAFREPCGTTADVGDPLERHIAPTSTGERSVTDSSNGQAQQTSPVEIFSIGKELLIGQIQDQQLLALAADHEARRHDAAHHDPDDHQPTIVKALGDAVKRGAKMIITTGGLGPTIDDLTVSSIAELLGVGTHIDDDVVQDHLRRRGITIDEHTEN